MLKRITIMVLALLFTCAVDVRGQTPSTAEELNRALRRTLAEVEQIKKAQNDRERELAETRKRVADYEAKNQTLTAECAALVRRSHQIEEEIIQLHIDLTNKELEAAALKAERDQYKRERNTGRKRLWVVAVIAAVAGVIAIAR